jgi:hypothetical protein
VSERRTAAGVALVKSALHSAFDGAAEYVEQVDRDREGGDREHDPEPDHPRAAGEEHEELQEQVVHAPERTPSKVAG